MEYMKLEKIMFCNIFYGYTDSCGLSSSLDHVTIIFWVKTFHHYKVQIHMPLKPHRMSGNNALGAFLKRHQL